MKALTILLDAAGIILAVYAAWLSVPLRFVALALACMAAAHGVDRWRQLRQDSSS